MTAQKVLAAWYEWDDRPKDVHTASALCDAVIDLADGLGTDFVAIRRAMASGRRCGHGRDLILAELEADAAQRMTPSTQPRPETGSDR